MYGSYEQRMVVRPLSILGRVSRRPLSANGQLDELFVVHKRGGAFAHGDLACRQHRVQHLLWSPGSSDPYHDGRHQWYSCLELVLHHRGMCRCLRWLSRILLHPKLPSQPQREMVERRTSPDGAIPHARLLGWSL